MLRRLGSSSPPALILRPRHAPSRPAIPPNLQESVRNFCAQTGGNPSEGKGSTSRLLQFGFGAAVLGAGVTAFIAIERPDILNFGKRPLSEKPSKAKTGDMVNGTINDDYKETKTNYQSILDGSDGAFDSAHEESGHIQERNNADTEDHSNAHKDLSPTTRQSNEAPFSQEEAYESAEPKREMSSKEEHAPAELKNFSYMKARLSEESNKDPPARELEEKYSSEVFITGDAVPDAGKEDETISSHNLPEADNESSISSDRKIHNDTFVKDVGKAGDAFTFLEVLHAAEERQAAADARIYNETIRKLKEKYEVELKDARAKELMYAEEASRLEKELAKEKAKVSATLKLQQEEAAENLRKELKNKEEEMQMKLNESELLAKTQLAGAIVQEKEAHLREFKGVQLEVDALNLAFHSHSKEARQSHTFHKLAVGTFAVEDAMKRGKPVEKEVALLVQSVGGYGSDPLLDVTIASLPENLIKEGTRTQAELHQRFADMCIALHELSLVPSSGGGFFTHALARLVSVIKVKEYGEYSDGIEAAISKVERHLREGRIADAADSLEKAIHGTKAAELAAEWIRLARNRAMMEQALSLLQAHATVIASSLT